MKRQDVESEVIHAVSGDKGVNTAKVAAELQKRFGNKSVAEIDDDAFWSVVAKHSK